MNRPFNNLFPLGTFALEKRTRSLSSIYTQNILILLRRPNEKFIIQIRIDIFEINTFMFLREIIRVKSA